MSQVSVGRVRKFDPGQEERAGVLYCCGVGGGWGYGRGTEVVDGVNDRMRYIKDHIHKRWVLIITY